MVFNFSEGLSVGGFKLGEVSSAMQKSIRRGLEEDALFWASELDLSGYGNYAFKRLRIIASEDVGLADSQVAVEVRCLYENWLEVRKAKPEERLDGALFLAHAVLLLSRALKSRIVDHALMVFWFGGERKGWSIPDYALDQHTSRGRRLKRGVKHFFSEGALLANPAALPDHYAKRALASAIKTAKS
ncbi:MAG: hypothetical protein ACHQ0J_13500 [Candidatus Dormibacterales bacterium]